MIDQLESIRLDSIKFWRGQSLELLTLEGEMYFSQLIDDEGVLRIQRPVNKKYNVMSITHDMPITVYFYDDEQGLCTFDSTLFLQQNKITAIKQPTIIKKAQRRRFFRVEATAELRLRAFAVEDDTNEADELEYGTFLTHDISGGGLSFHSSRQIVAAGDLVVGTLQLKTSTYEKEVAFSGRIVNIVKMQQRIFRISLEFIEMKESVRSDIVKYCMIKQIELRRKLMI